MVNLKDGVEMQQTAEPVSKDHYRQFIELWLRCYENPSMNNLRDHNGRTIWFKVQPLIYQVAIALESSYSIALP